MRNKEIILQAALQLFAEQGYDRTPTSQIAKTAQVSEGLIFRHFGNKVGLLAAIMEEGLRQIAVTMQAYDDPGIDPLQAIIRHIEHSLTLIREQEKFWRLATRLRFQNEVSAVAGKQLKMANEFIVSHLTLNLQKLGAADPAQEALVLFALIDGVCLHWLQDTAQYPLDSMKKYLIKKYTHGTI